MTIQNISAVKNIFKSNNIKNAANIQKQPKVNLKKPTDKLELSSKNEKNEVSAAKKVGVGIASLVIPGLGQLINKDVKKGAGFFLGNIALKAAATAFPVMLIPAIMLDVASVVDAVKNAK